MKKSYFQPKKKSKTEISKQNYDVKNFGRK